MTDHLGKSKYVSCWSVVKPFWPVYAMYVMCLSSLSTNKLHRRKGYESCGVITCHSCKILAWLSRWLFIGQSGRGENRIFCWESVKLTLFDLNMIARRRLRRILNPIYLYLAKKYINYTLYLLLESIQFKIIFIVWEIHDIQIHNVSSHFQLELLLTT